MRTIKFVCISDTHARHREVSLPEGDVLLFAGDIMTDGFDFREVKDFLDWVSSYNYEAIVIIAGNHDFLFERQRALMQDTLKDYPKVTYLENSGVTIAGINIWGSPESKMFGNWAFNALPSRLKRVYDNIPEETDILLTHPPAHGILDTYRGGRYSVKCGEIEILMNIKKRLHNLKYHVFGHIHEEYGMETIMKSKKSRKEGKVVESYIAINCSLVDREYQLANRPIVFEYVT